MRKLYLLAGLLFCINTALGQIAAWDFTGENTVVTSTAEIYNVNMDASNLLTRGAGAAASVGANSFRTVGFMNNGISTSNTDYFQCTLSAATGFELSLSTLDARFNGTATYFASPGVTSQFAYSLDGTNFTLIGSPVTSTSLTMTQIDLTAISALQNVPASTTITLRYYASGQTTTGGWGFFSAALGQYGFAIGGSFGDPLPVNFSDICAYQQGSGILIGWSNLTETDVLNYMVERSANGRNFVTLTTIPAIKNDGSRADYSWFDATPIDGVSFYRVRSLETDGHRLYSVIVRVSTKGGVNDITIYPNPASGSQISFQATLPRGEYRIELVNAGGQKLYTNLLLHNGGTITEALQLSPILKPGLYNLILSNGENRICKTFIIR